MNDLYAFINLLETSERVIQNKLINMNKKIYSPSVLLIFVFWVRNIWVEWFEGVRENVHILHNILKNVRIGGNTVVGQRFLIHASEN